MILTPPAKDGPLIAVAGTRFGPPTIEEEILSPMGSRLRLGMGADGESLIELCAEAEGVIIGAIPKFTAGVIAQLKRCKILARGGVGVDNIDLEAARKKGIQVTFVPDYCVDEVSDHAMALILYFARKLEQGIAEVEKGGWGISSLRPIAPLRGATLGIVGIGRIGAALAGKARAFGMRLIAHDPFAPESVFEESGAGKVALSRIWEESDYVSLHSPLTAETRGMVNAEALERMKTDAVLINVARGELVDEEALAACSKEKRHPRGGSRRAGRRTPGSESSAARATQLPRHAAQRVVQHGGSGGHETKGGDRCTACAARRKAALPREMIYFGQDRSASYFSIGKPTTLPHSVHEPS